jgi:hypothetical protein
VADVPMLPVQSTSFKRRDVLDVLVTEGVSADLQDAVARGLAGSRFIAGDRLAAVLRHAGVPDRPCDCGTVCAGRGPGHQREPGTCGLCASGCPCLIPCWHCLSARALLHVTKTTVSFLISEPMHCMARGLAAERAPHGTARGTTVRGTTARARTRSTGSSWRWSWR